MALPRQLDESAVVPGSNAQELVLTENAEPKFQHIKYRNACIEIANQLLQQRDGAIRNAISDPRTGCRSGELATLKFGHLAYSDPNGENVKKCPVEANRASPRAQRAALTASPTRGALPTR
jgi:hypothetical protein